MSSTTANAVAEGAIPTTDEDATPEQIIEVEHGKSVIDTLKEARAAKLADQHKVFALPGWSGKLHARFNVLPFEEVKSVIDKVATSEHPKAALFGNALTIAKACDEILVTLEGEEPHSLATAHEGEGAAPIKFDNRLLAILDLGTADSAMQCVIKTFENDVALMAFGERLGRWMEGMRTSVDDAFSGE